MRRYLTLPLLLLAAVPAPAFGATASVRTETVNGFDAHTGPTTSTRATFAFAAEAGEANAVSVALSTDGRTVTLRDVAAPVRPGTDCAALSPSEVRCQVPAAASGAADVEIALGDGDDTLGAFSVLFGRQVRIDAGAGDDRVDADDASVNGGDGNDTLRGSGSRTTSLTGGPGADALTGGAGDDALDGGPGRDTVDGGAGFDQILFAGETAPVRVDLAAPGPAGTAAEPDEARNVESALGGSGDDVLLGGAGSNQLFGGAGDDQLDGRGGDDFLDGGAGTDRLLGAGGDDQLEDSAGLGARERDVLDGAAGDDRLQAVRGGMVLLGGAGDDTLRSPATAARLDGGPGRDLLDLDEPRRSAFRGRCGTGRDHIAGLGDRSLVPRDCETILLAEPGSPADVAGSVAVPARLELRRGRLVLPLPHLCGPPARCRVRVEARVGSRRVARVARTIRRSRAATAAVRLSPVARSALRRTGRVRLRLSSPDAARRWTVTVRAPR